MDKKREEALKRRYADDVERSNDQKRQAKDEREKLEFDEAVRNLLGSKRYKQFDAQVLPENTVPSNGEPIRYYALLKIRGGQHTLRRLSDTKWALERWGNDSNAATPGSRAP